MTRALKMKYALIAGSAILAWGIAFGGGGVVVDGANAWGGPYVVTDFTPGSNAVFEAEVSWSSPKAGGALFGAAGSVPKGRTIGLHATGGGGLKFVHGGVTGGESAKALSVRRSVRCAPEGLWVDGVRVDTREPKSFLCGGRLTVFAANEKGDGKAFGSVRSLKVREPDARRALRLVLDLHPVVDADGRIALADSVSGKTFANANAAFPLAPTVIVPAKDGIGDVAALLAAFSCVNTAGAGRPAVFYQNAEIRLSPGVYALGSSALSEKSHLVLKPCGGARVVGLGRRPEDTVVIGGGETSGRRILQLDGGSWERRMVVSNLTLTGGCCLGANDWGGAVSGRVGADLFDCTDLIVSNNLAVNGGGIALGRASRCRFENNFAFKEGGATFRTAVTNSVFVDNACGQEPPAGDGAGLKWSLDGQPARDFAAVFAQQVGTSPLDAQHRDEAELRFHVGRSCPFAAELKLDFDALHPFGYYLVKKGRDVLFAGRSARGDAYAAFDFLKRFTGYRAFGGAFGLVVPKVAKPELPEAFSFREEPDVISYRCQWAPAKEAFERCERMTCQATHAMDQMITADMYKTHPEYFPLVNGQRVAPGSEGRPWNPCMSNPDLPDLFRAYAKRYFEKHPEAISVPMGVNDGGGDCNCEGCLKVFERHGNQYVEFYNLAARILQKEHPGKLLAFIGYSVRCGKAPSDGYRMEPNVLVEVTGNVNNYDEWKKAGVRNFGTYEYFYQLNNTRIAPACYPHAAAERLRDLQRNYGMRSFWQECFAKTSVFDGCRQYVTDELMWNLDADVDALVDDYHRTMYGPAAKAMRTFSDTAEEAFRDNPARRTFFTEYRDAMQFNGYTFERLAKMDAALREAAKLVRPGSREARRVELVGKYWAVSRLFADNWQCARALERETDFDRVVALAKRGRRDIEDIDRQRLSPEDETFASTDGRAGFFEEWKKLSPFDPHPPLEKAADAAFARLAAALGPEESRRRFTALAADPLVGLFAATQLSLMDNALTNLAQNGSFEVQGSLKPGSGDNTDWEPLGAAGWNWSRFPSTQAKAWRDDTEAHSGSRSVVIGPNPLGCWIVHMWRAEPDSRYRISFWAKCNKGTPGKSHGSLTVRMKDYKGDWLDDGSAIVANVTDEAIGKWAKFSVVFSTPSADREVWIVPVLSSPTGQKADVRLWFDDVSMEKLCSFRPHVLGQVEFAEVTLRDWLRNWDVEFPELKRDDSLPEGAFRAERGTGGRPLLRGGEEGLRIGLYAWAQAQGVRWFSPAESPVVPSRPEPVAGAFWGEHRPSFPYRGLHTCGGKGHYDPVVAHWMSFNGMNRRLDTLKEAYARRDELAQYGLRSDTCVHSFDTLVPAKKYFKDHPEYFSLIGGERKGEAAQRCLANGEFRRTFAEELSGWMEKVPHAATYGVCPNDGYGWCECADCRALDTAEDRRNGTVNGRMAAFVKELCARFPDRTIGNYSYSNFRDFYKLYDTMPPNLMLSTTVSHCQGHPLAAEGCPRNAKIWARLRELAASRANFYVYDYYTYLWDGLPAPMWQTVAADMKALHALGCRGFLSEVNTHRHDSWDGFAPALYVAARMLCDVNLTADALVEDWCRVRYGTAAKEMTDYFREWEKGVPLDRCFDKKPDEFGRIFRPKAERHLAAAERKEPDNKHLQKSRRLFDAWKKNRFDRLRWPAIRAVKAGKELEKVTLHFVRNSTQLADERNPTETELAVRDGTVRLRLTLKESKMWNLKSATGDLTSGDSVELFFDDGTDAKTCYHFVVSPTGATMASKCVGTNWNWNWKHHAKIAAKKGKSGWTVDFELPLADINARPDGFGLSLVRNRFAGGSWEVLGVPAGGAFFEPKDYIRVSVP